MSLKQRFEKTRDSRIRFNVIFASLIIIFLLIWCLEFMYSSIYLMLLQDNFFVQHITSTPLLIFNLIVASAFSYKIYYWHYLKDTFESDYSQEKEEENERIELTILDKVSMISFIMYKINPMILMISVFLFLSVKEKYLGGFEFILLLTVAIYFLLFIGKKMYKNIDRKSFKSISYKGLISSAQGEVNA